MRTLKVYGWMGNRFECPRAANGNTQTREICAAHSWAEVERIAGHGHKPHRDFRSVAGNAAECAHALARPGVVFWRPIDSRDVPWRRAKAES